MDKDVRCGTCKFHVGDRCEYFKSHAGPLWLASTTRVASDVFGVGCKVWEPAEPKVRRRCETCEHWSERGQGQDGYGHGPCMAPFPVWVFPEGVTVSREMAMFDGENCEMWKWREYEEDILDD